MNTTMNISAQHHAATYSSKRRAIVVLTVALAFMMDLLDATIVNVATPAIRAHLASSYADIQWVIGGYSLAFSILLVRDELLAVVERRN